MKISCESDAIHEEVVARVKATMPTDKAFNDLASLYKMFADNTRLKILWALSREELCVCDLAALLGMTKSAISHQLKSLRDANLVKFKKQGKIVFYSLVDCHVNESYVETLNRSKERAASGVFFVNGERFETLIREK